MKSKTKYLYHKFAKWLRRFGSIGKYKKIYLLTFSVWLGFFVFIEKHVQSNKVSTSPAQRTYTSTVILLPTCCVALYESIDDKFYRWCQNHLRMFFFHKTEILYNENKTKFIYYFYIYVLTFGKWRKIFIFNTTLLSLFSS